jgi:hypothetical protein
MGTHKSKVKTKEKYRRKRRKYRKDSNLRAMLYEK